MSATDEMTGEPCKLCGALPCAQINALPAEPPAFDEAAERSIIDRHIEDSFPDAGPASKASYTNGWLQKARFDHAEIERFKAAYIGLEERAEFLKQDLVEQSKRFKAEVESIKLERLAQAETSFRDVADLRAELTAMSAQLKDARTAALEEAAKWVELGGKVAHGKDPQKAFADTAKAIRALADKGNRDG